jgi:hypothetical protein
MLHLGTGLVFLPEYAVAQTEVDSNVSLQSANSLCFLQVSDWFPYPTKYRENMQSLDTAELLKVLDVVFLKIRGEFFHIRELKAQWHTSRAGFCSLRLRAAVDAYLDALETEARVALLPNGGKPRETTSSGTPIASLGGILKA